jgi:hypothetical protein
VNAPPSIPALPGHAAGPLRARRCVRHVEREAVARCSRCGGFFCRECVVDHTGKLVCAGCLAKATAVNAPKSKRSWEVSRWGLSLVLAVLVLWILFYAMGSLLLSVPGDFHDGTIWRKPFMD